MAARIQNCLLLGTAGLTTCMHNMAFKFITTVKTGTLLLTWINCPSNMFMKYCCHSSDVRALLGNITVMHESKYADAIDNIQSSGVSHWPRRTCRQYRIQ